jgi:hypothetical protein
MKGDFSRNTFDPKKHYRSVLKQQGRVDVDADWNEQQALHLWRIETESTDVIGSCGAPLHDAGFHAVTDGNDLTDEEKKLAGNQNPPALLAGDFLISAGRCYVDGILCQNEQIVAYSSQPDLPNAQLIRDDGYYIVYLDVWQRHINALDDPLIREKAMGGPDTASRAKTVWQVKWLPLQTQIAAPADLQKLLRQLAARQADFAQLQAKLAVSPSPEIVKALVSDLAEINRLQEAITALSAGPPTCAASRQEWNALVLASTGMLNARTQPPDPTERACLLPPSAGYRRLENQLYRVEIHRGATGGNPSFVWSRDNGTVVTAIKAISGNNIVVADVGPDDVLGFANGQWVEISDDEIELNGLPGQLLQIAEVTEASRTITTTTVPQTLDMNAHPKLRRWDQTGDFATQDGVPITFDWQTLEDGIEVIFSQGTYKTGDYWLVPARTATGELEWPPFEIPNVNPLPLLPAGIRHHYCRLALVQFAENALKVIEDCRKIFPPLTEIGTERAVSAIHVAGINWQNDDTLVLDESFFLETGLQITLDATPDPISFEKRLDSSSSANVIVTIEIPAVKNVLDASFIIEGSVEVSDSVVRWRPAREALAELIKLLGTEGVQAIMVRITCKGFAIWSNGSNGRLYLDGQALGIPGKPSSASRKARIDLKFPSGIGAPASDFQSWLFLVPPPPVLISLGLNPNPAQSAFPNSTGTVTLNRASPPGGTVVQLLSGDTFLATVPNTVLVAEGAITAKFNITVNSSPVSDESVPISAILGPVTKTESLGIIGVPR